MISALTIVVFAIQGLPADALVIETRELPRPAMNRSLALWMIQPERHPRDEDEAYTCPEFTRGSYYRGRTRVSLVDTVTNRILNTVEIREAGGDQFDVPYRILRSLYRVDTLVKDEGMPTILDLKDYNGDGNPLEFALFDQQGCSDILTQLVGYSIAQDRVIQYAINIDKEKHIWLDRFLTQKPQRPGHWRYMLNYNTGDVATFDIRYDSKCECFLGTMAIRPAP